MKIVSTSYTNTAEFTDPLLWLQRINFYTGILEALAKTHEVQSIEQINYSGQIKNKGVTYHFLNYKKPKLYFPFQLHNYIKKIHPDVVLVNGLIFPLQVMQLRLKLGKKVKLIVLNRGEKPGTGLRKFLQRLADKSINAYLFASDELGKAWISNGHIRNKNKIYEVVQGSSSFFAGDKNAARESLHIFAPVVFLWVGRLNANKDPLTVVKAFLQFLKIQPLAKLYMIYHTDELLMQLKSWLASANAPANAIVLGGKIANKDLQNWYSAADFIISGSHHESNGIAICEAMSCGCIPVLTSIPSFRRMTGPGKCGVLYEAGNDTALLAALIKTGEMDAEKERHKVLRQFNEELSFAAIAKKIDAVITSL